MAILRVRASSFVAANFANVANAVNAGDGTYATWTDSSRRGSTTGTFSGFDFSAISAQATLNSVVAEVRDLVNTPGDFANVTLEQAGSSWIPGSAAAVQQIPLALSLPSAIDLTFLRGNNTRSTTYSIDWLDIVVDYDPFAGSELQAYTGAWTPGKLKKFNGSTWEAALLRRWDGSQWVEVL